VHATAVSASQSMHAGQLSVRTMASCYSCCTQSRVHSTFRTCLSAVEDGALLNVHCCFDSVYVFTLFIDECTCQSMVSWELQQLDVDFDGHLSQVELQPLKPNSDKTEAACITTFTTACDHDKDGTLSEKEWCCCFADVCEYSSAYILKHFFVPLPPLCLCCPSVCPLFPRCLWHALVDFCRTCQ